MSKSLRIACVGEALIELITPSFAGDAKLHVADDTLNTAIYLCRARIAFELDSDLSSKRRLVCL